MHVTLFLSRCVVAASRARCRAAGLALALGVFAASATASTVATYSNTTPITITKNAAASPYPSSITVSGISQNVITKVQVKLLGLTHPSPQDLDILLVAPDGTRSIVMSDAGTNGVGNISPTFSSTASVKVPQVGSIPDGTVRPANYGYDPMNPSNETDVFPPTGPGQLRDEPADFDAFNGINPNGSWRLFVVDDSAATSSGTIAGGWQLILTAPKIYTVTVADDSAAATCSDSCSLRAAITDANTNGADGDLIRFSPVFATFNTIRLGSALPSITRSLTIEGPGAELLTISGGGHGPVIFGEGGTSLMLKGMTIRDGQTSNDGGAGIFSSGNVALRGVAVVGNRAQSYGVGGGVLLEGGIGNFVGSTFSDNTSADRGSAICVAFGSALRLANVTISGNHAGSSGAIDVYPAGAAQELEIVDSTIANNSSPGGGAILLELSGSSTVATTLRNSILAHNGAPNIIKSISGGTATTLSAGFNLVDDDGSYFDLGDPTTLANTDPLLGPLVNNGGHVETMALQGGSQAIDNGERSGYATDARGIARGYDSVPAQAPTGDNSDIGAVEMHAIYVVNTNDVGGSSLREAINSANGYFDGALQHDIVFYPGIFPAPETIALSGAPIDITSTLTITGPGPKLLTVTRAYGSPDRIFNISGGQQVAMTGLTISGGSADTGGGILSASRLSLAEVAVSGNTDSGQNGGGGIALLSADGSIRSSTISGNSALIEGGGIYFSGSSNVLRLSNTTIANNSAGVIADGVLLVSQNAQVATLDVTGSTIAGNQGGSSGGILALTMGDGSVANANVRNSIVAGNAAPNLDTYNLSGGTPSIVSLGYNLTDDPDAGHFNQSSDLFNTNPRLQPLADNGGPTLTMALFANSPAVDAGDSSGLASDQRGQIRPYDFANAANASGGDGADIGAYEYQVDDPIFRNGFD